MHLTLKRLMAPRSLEVRWGGVGDIHVVTVGWGGGVGCGEDGVDGRGGEGIEYGV